MILHLQCPLCCQEEDGGKAVDEEAPIDEDLYEKAEKEFWDIIQSEKKKMPDPSQDFEKSDTGKVNFDVAVGYNTVQHHPAKNYLHHCTACHCATQYNTTTITAHHVTQHIAV